MGMDLGIEGFEDAVEIGRGGFGVVYRARQPTLNRTVAIKMISSSLGAFDRERFAREGWAMGTLSGHPHIVSVYAVGIAPSASPYIVMAYLPRGSLADHLEREGALPWPEAVRIGIKLAGALETAHRAGTLHRDVKPENVLLSDYGDPQLADFGIARVKGGFETASGIITASMAHAAPEVFDGKAPTVASDVYALGSTLFTVLAGRPPFVAGPDEALVALYLRIAAEPVPDLRPDGVPDRVCAALEQALAKDPAARQGSTVELGRQLQEVERRAGLPVTEMALTSYEGAAQREALVPAPSVPMSPAAVPNPNDPPPPMAPATRPQVTAPTDVSTAARAPAGRRRGIAVAGIVAVAVALLAVVLVALRPDGREVVTGPGPGPSSTTATTLPGPDLPGVTVGNEPTSVAANPRTNRYYVANSGSLNVSVVDGTSRDVIATVPMPTRPLAVAVNQRGGRVYVTAAEASVVVMNGESNEVIGTVPLNARPLGLAVDHRTDRVFVATVDPVVAVIDGPTSRMVATIPLPAKPWSVAVLPDTNRVLVTSQDAGTLSVIDGGSLAVLATVPVGARPCGVAANPRNRRVYVTSQETGAVTVVDADANTVIGTVPVGSRPCGIAVNSQTNRVYVTDQETGKVTALDGSANQVLKVTDYARPARAPEPLPYGAEANPQTNAVYIVDRASNKLLTLTGDQL